MPTSNAATASGRSTSDYTQIFCPVINSYHELTGQDLKTHCAASDLVNPTAVLDVFLDRMQHFYEFRNGDVELMTCLQSTVDILFTISTELNLGGSADSEIVSVKAFLSYPIVYYKNISFLAFLARGNNLHRCRHSPQRVSLPMILFMPSRNPKSSYANDGNISYDRLLTLFQRLRSPLGRVRDLTVISYPPGAEVPLWQIMAEVLSTLAIFTKEIKEDRLRTGMSVPFIHPFFFG